MNPATLRALTLETQFSAFGVAATVTVPGGPPVATTVVWMAPVQEDLPVGHDLQRREPRRVLVVRRVDVPALPRGSVIVAAERGATVARPWKVDGIDAADGDQFRAIVTAG